MFNLTDRVSALHIPLKEQPQFMDERTDTVIDQLNKVLEPAFRSRRRPDGNRHDDRGRCIESRQTYERYRFLVTEESPAKMICIAISASCPCGRGIGKPEG